MSQGQVKIQDYSIINGLRSINMAGLNDGRLRQLAEELGADWEKLASFLSFSAEQVYSLKSNSPGQTENQIFNMLIKWRQQQSSSIDQIGALRKALREIGRRDLTQLLLGNWDLEDSHQGKAEVSRPPCSKHKGEERSFYCQTCQELICKYCTITDHADPHHRYAESSEASNSYKQVLDTYCQLLSEDIEGLQTRLADTSKVKKVFCDNISEAIRGVRKRAIKAIKAIKAEENRLIKEIQSLNRDRLKTFDEHDTKVTELIKRKQHKIDMTKDVMKKDDHAFLSFYPALNRQLGILCREHPPVIDSTQSFPRFMPNQTFGDIDLGRVVQQDTWKLYREFGKQGTGPGEFKSAGGIAAAKPDEIAVADWINERVVICNNKGQTKRSIPIAANDVAAIGNQWVFAEPSGVVRVSNKDDTLASQFTTVQQSEVDKTPLALFSVAVRKNGNIIVGDAERKVLIEKSTTEGSIEHTIPVETEPHYLAVMNHDRIAISDAERGRVDIVEVVDGKAATASSIKPTIGGQPVKHCTGVCSNSSGIYVAVSREYFNSGHIHHYDDLGQFVSCVAQGLYNPYGITFTADGQELAVADVHSVKMYYKV